LFFISNRWVNSQAGRGGFEAARRYPCYGAWRPCGRRDIWVTVWGRKGDIVGAREKLDELIALRYNGPVQATAIAAVYTGLGEYDRAVEWLEQAAQEPSA